MSDWLDVQPRYRSYQGYFWDPSYISHSHGWSSGPTSALTNYVLGLQVATPMGQMWTLEPHTSGLSAAEGGFETPLGWFGASWESQGSSICLKVSTPEGTSGVVTVPAGATTITLDGEVVVQNNGTSLRSVAVSGGNHTILSS